MKHISIIFPPFSVMKGDHYTIKCVCNLLMCVNYMIYLQVPKYCLKQSLSWQGRLKHIGVESNTFASFMLPKSNKE